MTEDPLQTPVRFVRGVGPDRAALLAKLQIETVGDLLWYLPRDLLDLTHVCSVSQLTGETMQTVRGRIVDVESRQLTGGRSMFAVLLDCDGEFLRGVWFHPSWVTAQLRHGQTVLFSAKPKQRGGRWEMAHPRVRWIEDDAAEASAGLYPIYGLTEGLKQPVLRRMIAAALDDYLHLVPEFLPEDFRSRHGLPHVREALAGLHRPQEKSQFTAARHRLIFDDLLEFQLGLALRRRAWRQHENAPRLPATTKIDARIRRLFPFSLTEGQNRAVAEIAADLNSGRAMHRLVQADVGAGKTVLAIYAMLLAVAAGYQAVLMVPTEVLAAQHWQTIDRLLAHSRVERRLLTGGLTSKERAETLADIQKGRVQLVVGTQAVIQNDVTFQRLGVVIIDEQHKFGVAQRARFSADRLGETAASQEPPNLWDNSTTMPSSGDDGPVSPHVLVMTATPIPRSLALSHFGDLDMTTISELPPGRQRVHTYRIASEEKRKRMWGFIREQLQKGRQVYVVCPRVDDAEVGDAESGDAESGATERIAGVETVYRQLLEGELKGFPLGLVHGRMDRAEKDEAMFTFRSGETRVLVSTTVIEVGIDVPGATLMVVVHAEMFGLSQLHQLRGRIARGKFPGYCFLLSESEAEEADRRLKALESTSDGFKIAEADFELRGPGDVLGTRQHGSLPLRIADLARDQEILEEAREAAFHLVETEEFDQPTFAPLKTHVLERFGRLMDLPKSG